MRALQLESGSMLRLSVSKHAVSCVGSEMGPSMGPEHLARLAELRLMKPKEGRQNVQNKPRGDGMCKCLYRPEAGGNFDSSFAHRKQLGGIYTMLQKQKSANLCSGTSSCTARFKKQKMGNE